MSRIVFFSIFVLLLGSCGGGGGDRPLAGSYNFILRAFDNTDVDADEVKNIYDAYPFDATKH